MPLDKKRAAPGAAAGDGAASKKRKMDAAQKFYAVRAGHTPGVYLNYGECQKQTAGFRGAVFKSFLSKADAEAFAAGKDIKTETTKTPTKFYAVAVGTQTGIFTEWADASEAIKGAKGPKYKKFPTRAEAVDYIRQFGNKETLEALGEDAISSIPEKVKAEPNKAKEETKSTIPDGVVAIYTDGSSLANGQKGSRAGLGVYFGPNDPRNISERLPGDPQTNQRAELMAILRALETVPADQSIQIFTDSQYSINCVTQWAIGWKKKGWVTANGKEVMNQDIIRAVLAKMDKRTENGGVTFYRWVKGHSADAGNEAADRLAVGGAKMPAKD